MPPCSPEDSVPAPPAGSAGGGALPIQRALPALCQGLCTHTRGVLHAPPGAGKSTVVPLALLQAPWLAGRRILMLEPRRLAARGIATRLADMLGERVGERVGYRVRLDSRIGPETRIEVLTEGILTRRLQSDPALEDVGCVIFDEFHERSLHADLGLALCLDTQNALREDLRLLLMSATLDVEAVAAHLGEAAVVGCPGRMYDVRTHYLGHPAGREFGRHWVPALLAALRRALAEAPGDVLVFLPGAGEIRQLQRRLGEGVTPGCDIHALYGELEQAAQEQALAPAPAGRRKVILATSIAETSLTIEGVRVVIDSGLARRARFDPGTGMSRLQTLPVSQAAAAQRRGRAGRLAPGVCYRLWSAESQAALAAFTPPEILEADLTPLALEVAAWGERDIQRLRWLDSPPAASHARARALLQRLGALDGEGGISAHGRRMAALGAHPRLAHMLLRGRALGLAREAAEMAALLSEPDLLRAPPGGRRADLRLRLEALRGDTGSLGGELRVEQACCRRVRRQAAAWTPAARAHARGSGLDGAELAPGEEAGLLTALAYPDRIARAREGARGRYLLAGGRGAVVADEDPLAAEPFLAVAEVDAGDRDARIHLAAPITGARLEQLFSRDIRDTETVAWDSRAQAVAAVRERRLERLVLEQRPLAHPPAGAALAAMLEGVRQLGLDALPWTPALHAWRARVALMHALGERAPGNWPDVSDPALLAALPEWLGPWLDGITRREHLARLPLAEALASLLGGTVARRLDTLAPVRLTLPSGARPALDYAGEDAPALSVRLQELFGQRETPCICEDRVPVTLRLLSPAGRPVQVTRDLASFWAGAYFDVRKDLRARYPRHRWPEDPLRAEPGARPRPRGR